MTDYCCHRPVAESGDEPQDVPNHVEMAKTIEINVIGVIPASGATKSAQIGAMT
jgi:hypothetical protein